MKRLLLVSALIAASVFVQVSAEELSMPTDVGKVALTDLPCGLADNKGFDWVAYATEDAAKTGVVNRHEGCWRKDGDIVYIWFYNEVPAPVASYKDYYFKGETND